MEHFLAGNVPFRHFATKCKTSVYVLEEICLQCIAVDRPPTDHKQHIKHVIKWRDCTINKKYIHNNACFILTICSASKFLHFKGKSW